MSKTQIERRSTLDTSDRFSQSDEGEPPTVLGRTHSARSSRALRRRLLRTSVESGSPEHAALLENEELKRKADLEARRRGEVF